MNSFASHVTQGHGQVTLGTPFENVKRFSRYLEYCERTASNFGMGFLAHCHQEHRQNEIHYLLSTLFRMVHFF